MKKFNANPKFSKPSKMPCRSWSLQALETCPASVDSNGELVPACKGCYATQGNYNFPNVKAPREHNKEDWKKSDWVDAMVSELDNDRYFRWFDSGDMYSLSLAEKIYSVMEKTPHVKHWLPTRMYKYDKFKKVLDKMQKLDNVVVRFSSDSITGEVLQNTNTSSTIIETPNDAKKGLTICKSYDNDGKCGTCRQCWDKTTKVIAYVSHGAKIKKQYRMIKLAVA